MNKSIEKVVDCLMVFLMFYYAILTKRNKKMRLNKHIMSYFEFEVIN